MFSSDNPKVTVVTNALNQGKYLRACIDSVLNQTYPNIEYIVVDPGSTDDTSEILNSYGNRLIVISEKDDGPADGLNKAFSRAGGEIFCYLNGDDTYLPNAIEVAVRSMRLNGYPAAIFGGAYISDEFGLLTKMLTSSRFTLDRFRRGNFLILQQSTFYRADLFRKVGGFNRVNWTSWDLELLVDFLLAGFRVVRIDDCLSIFRIHSESITGSQKWATKSKENHVRIFNKAFGRNPTEFENSTRKYWGRLLKLENPISYVYGSIIFPSKKLFDKDVV